MITLIYFSIFSQRWGQNIDTVTGIYDFVKLCEAANIKPLIGIEFRHYNKLLYIGLAKNRKGHINDAAKLIKKKRKQILTEIKLQVHVPANLP